MNRNDQQAYDRGTSLYSPDGRIYQVEYAREAVKRGAPSVGIRTPDGVVLAAQSRAGSSLMVQESIEKLHKLDDHVGAASAGHVADARKLVDFARRESQTNRLRYGEPIGIETLTKEITDLIQENTQRGGTRPYGAALLIGGIDSTGPRLFGTDPSGTPHEWKAVAIGGGRETIQGHLEEEYRPDLDLDAGVELAVNALLTELEEVEAVDLSVAVVSEDGYRALTVDEVDEHLDERATSDGEEDE
ncbi:archaeal proteasome endopeptidase complex subunit alpha [Halogranum rubrum]|uniref:Proteasome subunit alpha n=1 Tax=Halogranum salarium B-1 TaxID=1210908 RepID=J3JF21_9EURY|nr:archaeal proteasome endopeptidase complex subunit alpha [Halogranum salarium]EJN58841.1 proteasome subunit alpha [Halogranum salarium B-1]